MEIGAVNSINLQGMDLETALLAVQSSRANLLETQLKDQINEVQNRNAQIANLNNMVSALNGLVAQYGSGSDDATKIGDGKGISGWDKNEVLSTDSDKAGTLGYLAKQAGLDLATLGILKDGSFKDVKKGELNAAIQTLKGQIDALGNSQQMDMLRLQSLSNKRNEAFDTMTNFIKKMQDSRSAIIGNMR